MAKTAKKKKYTKIDVEVTKEEHETLKLLAKFNHTSVGKVLVFLVSLYALQEGALK